MSKSVLAAVIAATVMLPASTVVRAGDISDEQMVTALRKKYPNMRAETLAIVEDEVSVDIPTRRMACRYHIKSSGLNTVSFSNCYVLRGARP
jgi:hypothetical protein